MMCPRYIAVLLCLLFGAALMRAETKSSPSAPVGTVQITTGGECSPKFDIVQVAPEHFKVQCRQTSPEHPKAHWFLLKLDNVAGKSLQIDLANAPLEKWSSLNPVFAYTTDLADPALYESDASPKGAAGGTTQKAANGPELPDVSGQKWQFIADVSADAAKSTLILKQRFEKDHAVVAMRVPYTPAYAEGVCALLAKDKRVKIHALGKSPQGRALNVIQIGGNDEAALKTLPCIALYAREHADEHDSSWVVDGAIRALLADGDKAAALRSRATYLLIPMLDPDGAAGSAYEHITQRFLDAKLNVPECEAYMRFFETWVDKGYRLDVVLNLHNIESGEGPCAYCYRMEAHPDRLAASRLLHAGYIVPGLKESIGAELEGAPKVSVQNMQFRLCGALSSFYGALALLYEFNSQAPIRHLALNDMRQMGAWLLNS